MASGVIIYEDSTDGPIDPTSAQQVTKTYDGSGNMLTKTIVLGKKTFVQTMTYDGAGNQLTKTKWVKQ